MEQFLSIDVETTGKDEKTCQILEFGCVLGDFSNTPIDLLPSLRLRFAYQRLIGEPTALVMNSQLISDMATGINGPWYGIESLTRHFYRWLRDHRVAGSTPLTVAGKNLGSFDRRFLALVPGWDWDGFGYRFLDPGSLYFDPRKDFSMPSMATCCDRAGISVTKVHDALVDARLVVELIRAYYRGK